MTLIANIYVNLFYLDGESLLKHSQSLLNFNLKAIEFSTTKFNF